MKVFQVLLTYVTPLEEAFTTTLRVEAESLWMAFSAARIRFQEEYVPGCAVRTITVKEVT